MLSRRITISLLLSFVTLIFACSKQTETTKQPSGKGTIPHLKPFQFDTVTLDAGGNVINRRLLQADSYAEDLGGGVTLEMVRIPAGTFEMGAPRNVNGWGEEGPQHAVTVAEF